MLKKIFKISTYLYFIFIFLYSFFPYFINGKESSSSKGISVIVNAEASTSLDRIYDQDFDDFEVIVVDSNSSEEDSDSVATVDDAVSSTSKDILLFIDEVYSFDNTFLERLASSYTNGVEELCVSTINDKGPLRIYSYLSSDLNLIYGDRVKSISCLKDSYHKVTRKSGKIALDMKVEKPFEIN